MGPECELVQGNRRRNGRDMTCLAKVPLWEFPPSQTRCVPARSGPGPFERLIPIGGETSADPKVSWFKEIGWIWPRYDLIFAKVPN